MSRVFVERLLRPAPTVCGTSSALGVRGSKETRVDRDRPRLVLGASSVLRNEPDVRATSAGKKTSAGPDRPKLASRRHSYQAPPLFADEPIQRKFAQRTC
jgi:hypothetical protein